MAVNVSIAPFINVEFYLTGAFREPRGDHLHKGVDLSTGTDGSVYTIDSGIVIAKGYGLGYYGLLQLVNILVLKAQLTQDTFILKEKLKHLIHGILIKILIIMITLVIIWLA